MPGWRESPAFFQHLVLRCFSSLGLSLWSPVESVVSTDLDNPLVFRASHSDALVAAGSTDKEVSY